MDIPIADVPMWNVDNLCRACVEELNTIKTGTAAAYVNILEIPELLHKLSTCISNEFSTTNKFSKYLCMDCYRIVNEFYEFRIMCIDSMRHFEELQHTENTMFFEEDKPFPYSNAIYIKEESMPDLKATISDNANASIIVKEDGGYQTKDEKKNSIISLSTVKATIRNRWKSRQKRTIQTVGKAVATMDDVKSGESNKNDRDLGDNELKTMDAVSSGDNSSLNEWQDSPEDIVSRGKRRNKSKAAKPTASKAIKSKTKKESIYRCEICPSRFFVEHRLIAHNREHKGLKPYPCTREGCVKSFSRSNDLSRHVSEHEGANIIEFVCDQEGCDKVYKYKAALNIHKRKIHKLGPELKSHVCEICGKVFKSTTILREHRYTHKDKSERPYVCDQPNCTRRFANKDKLKVHLKRHAGIKNYVCSHCGMRKTTKNELTIHMNYHTLERTWPCRLCKKVCNSAGNLKTHIRTVHERLKEYACRHCDRKFAKPDTRKYHEMRHTGEKPNVCSECGKGFIQPAALRTHMKVHGRQQERCAIANNLSNSNHLISSENEPKPIKNG